MQVPASAQLGQLATGHLLPRCLHVVAELGVADHLAEDPGTAESLADATGAHAGSLERILRLLAVAGVFERRSNGWAHTELSRLLRSDHPQSMRSFIRMIGGRLNWTAAGELMHSARTGKAALEKVAPGGIWAHLADHPDEARIFDGAMIGKSSAEIAALIPAFDFTRYRAIADIGGGRGHILAAVLTAAPRANGILFDRAQVLADLAPPPRMSLQAGDFFNDALPAADAYILGNILHDWPDNEAEAILRSVHRAAPKHAELLVLENILPEGPEPHLAKVLDIVMMIVTGGRERTRDQYQMLLASAGFRLERIVPLANPISVIVAVLA